MQPGITLRDLVNAIPYVAIQRGFWGLKTGSKKNVFSGRILEIRKAAWFKSGAGFWIVAASAERSEWLPVAFEEAPIREYWIQISRCWSGWLPKAMAMYEH